MLAAADTREGREGLTLAVHPDGPAGSFRALLSKFEINGQDAMSSVDREVQLQVGDVTVHLPNRRHPGEDTDGPMCVVVTPDAIIHFLVESEVGVVGQEGRAAGFGVWALGGIKPCTHLECKIQI